MLPSVAITAKRLVDGRSLPLLVVGLAMLTYLSMYADGSVPGAALGPLGGKLSYLHEFFHHARHLGFACH